jgi:RNA polymerase sigma-70 factor, ECF subfamily
MTEPPVEERELLRDLAAGREAAYARLYDQYGRALYATALRITGSREEAEDTVQELFTSLVRSRRHLPGTRNLKGYLFASLRRAAIRVTSTAGPRAAAHDATAEHASEPDSQRATSDRAGQLERAVAALPTEQREVISLKIDGGLTFAEIAAVLEISPNTAASRYRYALEKLRALIKEG